jgi:hypothetical protein
MTWNDARALGVFLWLNSLESMVRKSTNLVLSSLFIWTLPEITDGSHRPGGIYGWRFPRSSCQFSVLFRSREAQVGSGSLAAGRMAQRAGSHVTIHVQRFYATAMANCSPQKRVCFAGQASFWCVASLDFRAVKLTEKILEYAAAFFVLAGSLKDAVNVCLRHLDDFQLAVALARVVEGRDDGPVLRDVLYENIIPLAFKKGNRWLGSWAFWLLHRRDLAVRILVVSGPALFPRCITF